MPPPRTARALALVSAILILSGCNMATGPSQAESPLPTLPPPAPTAAPTATAEASTGTAIHLVKDCSTFVAEIPSYCTITTSDDAAIPVGAKVNYLGPLLDNPMFLSSNVLIDDANGNTATGYCIFDARPAEERGFCAFSAGTGALKGFTAILKVTIDSVGAWHLDGEYYGGSPSPSPS